LTYTTVEVILRVFAKRRRRAPMKEYQSLSHTRWDCKYHVVFIPKRRKKRIFGILRRQLGEIFRELAQHKESQVVEGHLRPDHVHSSSLYPKSRA